MKIFLIFSLLLMGSPIVAQNSNCQSLKFNSPYISANRSVVLPVDWIPNEFLGCTLGVTSEVDALKNINRLGLRYSENSGGVSDVLTIYGDIECEGAQFRSVSLWFYNNMFWKIVFENMKTDSKALTNTICRKYSKFPRTMDGNGYDYIRYNGYSADLVHNQYNLQYTVKGGSSTRLED